ARDAWPKRKGPREIVFVHLVGREGVAGLDREDPRRIVAEHRFADEPWEAAPRAAKTAPFEIIERRADDRLVPRGETRGERNRSAQPVGCDLADHAVRYGIQAARTEVERLEHEIEAVALRSEDERRRAGSSP